MASGNPSAAGPIDGCYLVTEDGPTLTHGEMTFGAGTVAALKFGAREIVDPRPQSPIRSQNGHPQ